MGPNCIPDLIPAIAEGRLYAYQVLPSEVRQIERATLVIVRCSKKGGEEVWIPEDARTRRNQPIAETTRAAIDEFLCRNQDALTQADLLLDGLDCLLF